MQNPSHVLSRLEATAARDDDRVSRAREAAEHIRLARGFHWVGLYDVTPSEICVIAWTGATAPRFPTFPRTQGLNGAAVVEGRPIVINDVRKDPRYLTTFGSTLAEADGLIEAEWIVSSGGPSVLLWHPAVTDLPVPAGAGAKYIKTGGR